MNHCYIFDYTSTSIYHVELPDDVENVEDVEDYLHKNYNFSSDSIYFMTADEELTIKDL